MSYAMTEWSSRDLGLALGLTPQEVERIHENRSNGSSTARRWIDVYDCRCGSL